MSQNGTNPYVFVVGCPRSGTTLLQRMLDAHPELSVANDTHFVPRCLERFSPQAAVQVLEGGAVPLTPELLEGVIEYKRFRRLGVDEATTRAIASDSAGYADFVSRLYTRFAKDHDKPYGGEKTPDFVKRLDLLHALFPHTKLVHIVRDGRDVALSVLEWAKSGKGPGRMELWDTEPVAVAALWWSWQIGLGRASSGRIPSESYTEVLYEDLVARPEDELRRLAGFLGLGYSDSMAAFHRGKTRHEEGLSAKSAWLPATRGLRDRRSQMSERDVALFEALAGELLTELGYERAVSEPPREIRGLADACRVWWRHRLAERDAKDRRREAEARARAASSECPA